MGPQTSTPVARARRSAAFGRLLALICSCWVCLVVVAGARPAAAQAGCTPVMGRATATPGQLAGWFATAKRQPKLDVSVADLATMFVEEGAREGVRGDIAFAQAIVETGFFNFSPSVPPELHNYSGLGATGGGVRGAAFPDARTGVRAQIQHLRGYADPTLRSAADLHAPLVDPRFRFLVPNPRTVPCWEQFGGGVWAADPSGYGPRVLSVHQRISAFPAPAPAPTPAPAPAVVAPASVAPAAPAPAVVVPAAAEPNPPAVTIPDLAAPAAPVADPTLAELFAADLEAVRALALEPAAGGAAEESLAELVALPAGATRSSGGGTAGAVACLLAGGGLLTMCVTMWWHGRRFVRAAT